MATDMMTAILGNFSFGPILWLIMGIGIMVIVSIGLLYAMRSWKYIYPILIIREFGNGKIGFYSTRAGKFRKRKAFLGLIETGGEYELITKDKRKILEYTDWDMHTFNDKRCFVVIQKPDDPKILIPIQKMTVDNKEAMMSIAPADFRDAAVGIIRESEEEMKAGWEKAAVVVMPIAMGIILMITVLFVVQYGKYVIDASFKYAQEALAALKNIAQTTASTGAP